MNIPDDFEPCIDGLHTVAACGRVTLVDAKRSDCRLRDLLIDVGRCLR